MQYLLENSTGKFFKFHDSQYDPITSSVSGNIAFSGSVLHNNIFSSLCEMVFSKPIGVLVIFLILVAFSILVALTSIRVISEKRSASPVPGNIALPKDTFESYFSYLLYEITHFSPFVFSFVVLIILIISVENLNVHTFYIVLFVWLFIADFMGLGYSVFRFNAGSFDDNCNTKLLLEVITRKPAVKGEEWRTITCNMNQYLFDNELWDTPYYFHSENSCHRYFITLLEGKHLYPQSDTTAIDAQWDVLESETSDDAAKSYTFSSKPDLERCRFQAASLERQAQREYWRKHYPDSGVF
ncbi:hypothetical protein SUVZ_08G3620 [Saccharomyces uvarum]|uniref:Uncharacterized protein n=1 Tax=Saccharomyces uvarum TaxID=230603 RepID=A0ABN8X0I5_SACUV|nr:hypothetical protein SUVZ_08G3620 [Saccharomyces uvarum]